MTMTFKCKMCGGELDVQQGKTVAECMYCGSKQTIPVVEDERTANLFDRANHFRRNNEFDKALGIYEQILNSGVKDAEAYWSVVLCKYGIEYVEDPQSGKRVPTVNRTSLTSIFDDADYKAALALADDEQKDIFESEAKEIDRLQKQILSISANEEPFDIFICYKETDDKGRRTPDSVLAYDIYKELADEGYRVFFSRVTLEDKLGEAYEPYIFAALTSAKVMVAVGTKPEFFNAVWVKNEWSRYLSLIKNGEKKTLIPVYRDMDPYDLPEEFSHLQGLDMAKLGFMQDLVRGIRKIAPLQESDVVSVVQNPSVRQGISSKDRNENFIKRAWDFVEDGKWDEVGKYVNDVLDTDATNAEAHLLMFMLNHRIKSIDDILKSKIKVSEDVDFKKALRYAKDDLRTSLEDIEKKQSSKQGKEDYDTAQKLSKGVLPHQLFLAKKKLIALGDYNDAVNLLAKVNKKFKKSVVVSVIILVVIALGIGGIITYRVAYVPWKASKDDYDAACALFDDGKYIEANSAFAALDDFMDSKERAENALKTKYDYATTLLNDHKFDEAYTEFEELGDYSNAKTMLSEVKYAEAVSYADSGDYTEAIRRFTKLDSYSDSADRLLKCHIARAKKYFEEGKYELAAGDFSKGGDEYSERTNECYFLAGQKKQDIGELVAAIGTYNCIPANSSIYNDAKKAILECKYEHVTKTMDSIKDEVEEKGDKAVVEEFSSWSYEKEYLTDLYKDNEYKDKVEEIYQKATKWYVEITAVNDSESDYITDKKEISKDSTIYYHFDVYGGPIDAALYLKATMNLPGCKPDQWENPNPFYYGYNGWFSDVFTSGNRPGKADCTIYNSKTNEKLAYTSVQLK